MSRPTPTERANAFPIPLTGTGRVADRVFRDRLAAQFAEVEADARREAMEKGERRLGLVEELYVWSANVQEFLPDDLADRVRRELKALATKGSSDADVH